MPAPALAAIPILVSFAEAAGIVVAGVATAAGIDTLSKKVEEYVEENPEQSQKILAMIMPAQGIANILKNESDDGEEVSEEEVAESESGSTKDMVLEELNKETGNYSDPNATGNYASKRGRIIGRLRREGKIRQDNDPNYDASKKYKGYTKFYGNKKAEGGIVNLATGGTPYDSRATATDYANALQTSSAGTDAQKRKSLGNYIGNLLSSKGQQIGNAGTMALQGAKGVLGIQGTPITDSMQTSLQNIIQNQIKNSGKLSGNINYKDYGVKTNTQGNEFIGFGDRSFTDPEAALATTLGQASYSVDPKTGKITFTGGTAYDFGDDQFGGLGKFISKGGVFNDQATQYNPNISLGSDFINQSGATMTDFQKYKTTMLESLRKNHSGQKTAMTDLQPDGSNSGPARALPIEDYFNYMFADKKSLGFDPATGQKLADGGRVGLFMGGDPGSSTGYFNQGGLTGNKTYHQVRDQFMPMDSESMGYANGGGIGSMMKPKKKRVSFRGGGMDMGNEANQAQSASMGNSSSSGNDGPRGPAELGLTTRAPPGTPSGNDDLTILEKIKNNPIINNPFTRVLGRVGLYSVNPTLMGLDYRTAMQLKGVYDTATEEVDEEDLKFQNGGSVGVGSMFVRKK